METSCWKSSGGEGLDGREGWMVVVIAWRRWLVSAWSILRPNVCWNHIVTGWGCDMCISNDLMGMVGGQEFFRGWKGSSITTVQMSYIEKNEISFLYTTFSTFSMKRNLVSGISSSCTRDLNPPLKYCMLLFVPTIFIPLPYHHKLAYVHAQLIRNCY